MPRTPPVAPAGRVARPQLPETAADETRRTSLGCQARLIASSVLALALLGAAAVNAQRLWSVGEVATRPLLPIEVDGVASAATAGGTGPLTAEAAAVQVTFDYLRLGMGYLELPLPDGSMIAAENAVFEDRGNGNLMWTGEVPGAGYESVVLTVQDGHLVGWFGAPGGPKYVVYAGPDGRGSLAVEVVPTGDWCGVEGLSNPSLGGTRAMIGPGSTTPSVGRPARTLAADESRLHRQAGQPVDGRRDWPYVAATGQTTLDFVVLYTSSFARSAERVGGVSVNLQFGFDHLNLVFRNGSLPAEARLLAAAPASPELEEAASSRYLLLSALARDPSAGRLRQQHGADLVHLFSHDFGVGGVAYLFTGHLSAGNGFGVSSNVGGIFAHEVGHNLGGLHEPEDYANFSELRESHVEPFAFAHVGRSSEGEAVCTTLATGYYACSYEPYYSSVRHSPPGWTIGVAGERENERVFHETVHDIATTSTIVRATPLGPSSLEATVTGERSVRLMWEDNSHNEDGFSLQVFGADDGRGISVGANTTSYDLENLSAPIYRVTLHAVTDDHRSWWNADAGITGLPLTVGKPLAPYDLQFLGSHWWRGIPLNWKDSAADEEGFRVRQVRGGSGVGGPAPVVAEVEADGTSAAIRWKYVLPGKHISRYEVESFNAMGSSRSEIDVDTRRRFPVEGEVIGDNRIRLSWGRGLGAVEQFYVSWAWSGDGGFESRTMFTPGTEPGVEVEVPDLRTALQHSYGVRFAIGMDPSACHPTHGCAAYWANPGRIVDPARNYFYCFDGFGVAWELMLLGDGDSGERWHVSLCFEDPAGWQTMAWNYELESSASGLMYFFDRDNVEALVKVLNGCAINGHHWVFVAPVTDLKFQLRVRDQYGDYWGKPWLHENRVRGTARTASDTTAFACTEAEVAAAKAEASHSGGDSGPLSRGANPLPRVSAAGATPLAAGARTDCEPGGPALTLGGGYRVSMCYEMENGEVGDARDWGLDSSQMGLLYFSERDSVEALVKVVDGCAANGNVSVFVAPATEAAFNLHVESPDDQVWTLTNRLGQTAEAVSDISAFPCAGSPPVSVSFATSRHDVSEGETIQITVRLSEDPGRDLAIPLVLTHLGGATDADYSGVPDWVRFSSGVTTREFDFIAAEDSDLDDGESVVVGIERLPLGVSGGGQTRVVIRDTTPPPLKAVLAVPQGIKTGVAVTFDGSGSTGADSYQWFFGDGTYIDHPNTVSQPTHTYSRPGTYEVTLNVAAGDCGGGYCEADSATAMVEVESGLKAVLGVPPSIETGTPVTIDGSGSTGADSYQWFFGDGTFIDHPNTVSQPTHTYTRPGTYEVTLNVAAGDCGGGYCEADSATAMVEVEPGPPPVARFDFSADCDANLCVAWTGAEVEFEDASSGTVEHILWDFGDGESSRDREPSHTWTSPGFYRVVLTAHGLGETSTASKDILVRASNPAGTCEPDKDTLCLGDSRYRVRARWRTAEGAQGQASVAYAGTNDSGLFWFFDRENWEMLIKVLDGCAVNGNVWVFGASTTDLGYTISVTDTVTGDVKFYRNQAGKPAPAVTDTKAFAGGCDGAGVAAQAVAFTGESAADEPLEDRLPRLESVGAETLVGKSSHEACTNAPWALCLQDGRYEVVVWWRTSRNSDYSVAQRAPARTRDSGLYSFFDAKNWEMLIKVLDGCAVNGQHWVYAASATDLGFQIRVTDTETDVIWRHSKQPGKPAEAVTDSEAFPNACKP